MHTLGSKFGTGGLDFIEEHLQSTGAAGGVGLVSKQEYKMRRERVELAIAQEEEKMINRRVAKMEQKQAAAAESTKKQSAKQQNLLSFQDEEEEEEVDSKLLKKRTFRKNPDVNTQFL
jgi:hypothetical protein